MHLAPPVVSFLANNDHVKPEHLSSIKTIFVSAAPFDEVLAYKFREKAPHVKFREGKAIKMFPNNIIIKTSKTKVDFKDF